MIYVKPYIEIVANLKAMLNFSKEIDLSEVKSLQQKIFKDSLSVTPLMWLNYKQLVRWKKKVISPIFPYSLLTHLHIQLATHDSFPGSPLGILHKRETIQQLGNLKLGKWDFETHLDYFKAEKNGYELSIITNLFIDGILVWQSETIGFIKQTDNIAPTPGKNKKAKIDLSEYTLVKRISARPLKANRYAWISGNIDPIHFWPLTAKLMGHPTSIMHGMWSVGRIAAVLPIKDFKGAIIHIKFISGFYLPGKADILIKKEGSTTKFVFNNTKKEKPYLIGDVVFNED